jgi:N-acetylmuramoyl-L-alanine amidase
MCSSCLSAPIRKKSDLESDVMKSRSRRIAYEDFISPADRAYADFAFRNPRSLLSGASSASARDRTAAASRKPDDTTAPKQPSVWIPDLPTAGYAGGKVVQGPAGSMKSYRLRRNAFLVPSGEIEDEVVAGVNYLALAADGDVTFATHPSGEGLTMSDQWGQSAEHNGKPVFYSWQQLRDLGKLGIVPREKWTAETPRPGGYRAPDLLGRYMEDPVTAMSSQKKPYSMITLHHTGSRDAEGVMALHHNKIPWWDRIRKKAESETGFGQSYDDYADIGYHFLIDEEGRIFEGRSIKNQGAHVRGHNLGNLGIAIVGDHSSKPLSPAQLRAVEFLTRAMKKHLGIVPDERGGGEQANSGFIYRHGEFDADKRDELMGAKKQLDNMGRKYEYPYRDR